MENKKTIRQIADEIGVSKQAIHKKRKKEPLSTSLRSFTTTVDGVVYISVDGVKLLKQAFLPKVTAKGFTVVDDNQLSPVDNGLQLENAKIIDILEKENEFLKEQLKVKDKQLDEKDSQLKSKDEIIKREQELRLISEKNLLLISSVEENTVDTSSENNKWWQFWK